MSKTEAMGRLYAHGFQIVDETRIGDNYYFVFHKIKKPLINHVPTYGIIFKMLRKGKDGKLIYVYKMRTMDAYSEYLQQYVYEQNNLHKGGKFKDDFRMSTLGKFLRKYWIDELPMIVNLLKGDIKLVGVRPLGAHYLSLYSGTLREKRSHHKPGLIPPFYADMPETIVQIMASEMRYLHSYERSPFKTDVKYFIRIFHKIVFKHARSK
jgi:lipopolysaccharide/colanic/teichoic acid biosynthesis glycosyltransferase